MTGPTRARASASGVSLTGADASLVKGMLQRGDRQHDVAAWFGVNAARINEIARGIRYLYVQPAPRDQLPPGGPYNFRAEAADAKQALKETVNALASVEARLNELVDPAR